MSVKKLVLAALLAGVATQADAVIISFKGDASLASYIRTYSGGESVYDDDAPTPSVTGKIFIDTHAIGENQATAPAVYYDAGGAAFLTGSFTSTGATPTLQSTGAIYSYVDADPDPDFGYGTIEFDYEYEDPEGVFHSSTFLFGSYLPVPTALIHGVLLPDFSQATEVYFTVTSREGTSEDYVETVSSGYASRVSLAVPEPLTWATMVVGFGLVGGGVRRRRREALAA